MSLKKMLVFEILECGLYHEKKRYLCMSKCGRYVFKTRRYDSALSTHFSFQPPLNSCGRPARAVIAKSRARHVHVVSLNLLTSRKSPLI